METNIKELIDKQTEYQEAVKQIKITKDPPPLFWSCIYCGAEWSAPIKACWKTKHGGDKIHWWSNKTNPIWFSWNCYCPFCKTINSKKI